MATTVASKSAAFHVDVAVIGAGVVGLAISRSLALAGREVLLLDRAASIGSETSARNSEVIHAGLYYPKNSLKAQFCVKGKKMLYDYCKSRNIDHHNCGKLIVATQAKQLSTNLPQLQQHALQNGVDDTLIMTAEDVKAMEPHVTCKGALWSPSTGVIDSHSFMLGLLADAKDHGASLALHSNVTTSAATTERPPRGKNGGIFLRVDADTWLQCRTVINSAGLWAHQVAQAIHWDNNLQPNNEKSWQIPRQYFAKGNYFRLEGSAIPFHHLVYPLPEPGGLGVHATMDWGGLSMKFGPDVQWIDPLINKPEVIEMTPDPSRADGFYQQIRKYWPDLPDNSLVPDYAGIRPKLHHPSLYDGDHVPFHDFIIATPKEHGIPGLIHLFGIESPGLTSSMAIGDYVAKLVASWDS